MFDATWHIRNVANTQRGTRTSWRTCNVAHAQRSRRTTWRKTHVVALQRGEHATMQTNNVANTQRGDPATPRRSLSHWHEPCRHPPPLHIDTPPPPPPCHLVDSRTALSTALGALFRSRLSRGRRGGVWCGVSSGRPFGLG